MAIKKDTLDDLLAGRDPKAVFSKDGLFDELNRALAERVLNAELDDHLDNEGAEGSCNRRNGSSKKTVLTETAKIDIRIPRDREGTFDPKLIQRYQRRFCERAKPIDAELETMRIEGPEFWREGCLERAEMTGFLFERERECVRVRGRLSLRGRPLAPGDRLIRGSRQ